MTSRRKAREWAMQFLYQREFHIEDLDASLRAFLADKSNLKACQFAQELIRGVTEHIEQIDGLIQNCAEHWDLARIGKVERNILRIAIYEMLFREDIPPVVTINEAVDVAKNMSDQAAGRFVNGILDHVRRTLNRPARIPVSPKETFENPGERLS